MRDKPILSPGLVLGLVILALGVILLLDRQDIIDAREILRFWPLALVALGIAKILQPDCPPGRVWGGLLVLAGGVIQLDILGYAHISFRDVWPLILIAIGVLLVWRAVEARSGVIPAKSASVLNQWVAFGGGQLTSNARDFAGGEVLAVFGGYEIDLRDAAIEGSQAVIHANAMFGGVEIKVPESWNVIIHGVPILGGYADKTRHPKLDGQDQVKNLVVKGFAMFGGVEVKN